MKYLLSLSLIALSGCTANNVYDNIQYNNLQDCNKEPTLSAQEVCRKANSLPYKDYEKERQKP